MTRMKKMSLNVLSSEYRGKVFQINQRSKSLWPHIERW